MVMSKEIEVEGVRCVCIRDV